MIRFDPLWKTMEQKGVSAYMLREKCGITTPPTVNKTELFPNDGEEPFYVVEKNVYLVRYLLHIAVQQTASCQGKGRGAVSRGAGRTVARGKAAHRMERTPGCVGRHPHIITRRSKTWNLEWQA